MSVLHRIKLPPKRKSRQVVVSDFGDWQCCADEVHSFYEPMVQLTVSIDADHILHMFCEADQVDAAIAALRDRLTGNPEATPTAAGSAPAIRCVTFSTPNHLPTAYAMTTTIPEAKASKAALEQIIANALRQFSADTGTTVTSVFIDPVIVLGAPASYRVEVEARL